MNLSEIKNAVGNLSCEELAEFRKWYYEQDETALSEQPTKGVGSAGFDLEQMSRDARSINDETR